MPGGGRQRDVTSEASEAMAAAEAWLRAHGVWKLNLMIRDGNEQVRGFYEALGYETEPRVVMSRRLEDEG